MPRLTSLFLLTFFIGLAVHFHEHDALNSFHFHDLSLRMVNQAFFFLTDGHACACFLATLDMPAPNTAPAASLKVANFSRHIVFPLSLLLTWEIFHPPQVV